MNLALLKDTKNLIAVITIAMLTALNEKSFAQIYYEDFETLTKSSYAAATVTLNGMDWIFAGSNAGNTANDFKIGNRSARLAGTTSAATNSDTSKIEMSNNKPGGIGDISFVYKQYGTDANQIQWLVQWSDDGVIWHTMDTIKGNDTQQIFSHSLNEPDARIRVYAWNFMSGSANSKRLNIDSLALTDNPVITLSILGKTPVGHGITIATDSIKITFSEPIIAGSGELNLFKTGNANPIYTGTATTAIIHGNEAVFHGVALANATNYQATLDASSFMFNGVGHPSINLGDWTFKTIDTLPQTFLNETFTDCNQGINQLGIFQQYSVSGAQAWGCTSFAHDDAYAVYVNGGYSSGYSEENEDWLISSVPFDFSGMTNPNLSFWQMARFDGTVNRTIKISSDYLSGSNPLSANWITLNVPALDTMPRANSWSEINGIDLTNYKSTPFYLAFTYECGTSGAWELSYDDIKIQNPTSIAAQNNGGLDIRVLGIPTTSQIILGLSMEYAGMVNAKIIDMTGRMVHFKNFQVSSGQSTHTISNLSLNSGIYVILLSNEKQVGVIKILVK